MDEDKLLESWQPEPLVPQTELHVGQRIISSKPGRYITVDGVKCLNVATHNYLGLVDDERLEQASIAAARKYGVGSCGPRAFYGTMDIHLNLEEQLAQFLGLDEAILYSFGFATIASAISAYAKSTDIIFVDEFCNFAIQKGIAASKAKVFMFEHNNVQDLERLISHVAKEQVLKYGTPNKVRTFIIVEGIYAKTGEMCPLEEVVKLKRKHKIRLFIDESKTFGVLGSRGKGITEYLNINIHDMDLIMVSLENALCGYGGFCAGSSFVVDHQRLAGSGYCFSASLPPLQAACSLESLKLITQDVSLISKAQEIFEFAHETLKGLTKFKNLSHPLSPIKVLVFRSSSGNLQGDINQYYEQIECLDAICAKILSRDQIAITVARYLAEEEMTLPMASIRLAFSGCMTKDEVLRIFASIESHSSTIDISKLASNKVLDDHDSFETFG